MTEAELQAQIVELATLFGYSWVHFRPAKTEKGWRTPVSGPLGKGFPDLVLARPGRLIMAEVKSARGRLTLEQIEVLDILRAAGVECHVWRPADFDSIVEVLR